MSTRATDKATLLRRDIRDLEQQAERLEELAVDKLTTDEASARFSAEAQDLRQQVAAKEAQLKIVVGSKQTSLFNDGTL